MSRPAPSGTRRCLRLSNRAVDRSPQTGFRKRHRPRGRAWDCWERSSLATGRPERWVRRRRTQIPRAEQPALPRALVRTARNGNGGRTRWLRMRVRNVSPSCQPLGPTSRASTQSEINFETSPRLRLGLLQAHLHGQPQNGECAANNTEMEVAHVADETAGCIPSNWSHNFGLRHGPLGFGGDDMTAKWLRALAVSVVLVGSIVLAPGVAAQKGAGGLPPAGTYQFTSAGTDFSSFAGNMQISLNVSSDTNVSQPTGAPQTTTSETQVFLNLFDYSSGTFTSACLLLDHPSDFTINKELTTASLTTTLTPATPTCPYSSPLTTTIGLNGTWTGAGPLATTRDESTYQCGSYTLDSVSRNLNNSGSANLSLTMGGTSTSLSAGQIGLNSNNFQTQAHGVAAPGCGLTGFGTGPMPAGKYHIFGLNPNAFFGMPPGPTNQISLFENNSSSQPDGGTAR